MDELVGGMDALEGDLFTDAIEHSVPSDGNKEEAGDGDVAVDGLESDVNEVLSGRMASVSVTAAAALPREALDAVDANDPLTALLNAETKNESGIAEKESGKRKESEITRQLRAFSSGSDLFTNASTGSAPTENDEEEEEGAKNASGKPSADSQDDVHNPFAKVPSKTDKAEAVPPPPPPKPKPVLSASRATPTIAARERVLLNSARGQVASPIHALSPSMVAVSSPDGQQSASGTPVGRRASPAAAAAATNGDEEHSIEMLPGEELCSSLPGVKIMLMSAHRHTLVGKLTITSYKLVFEPELEGLVSTTASGRRRRTQVEDALFMPSSFYSVPVACIAKIARAPGGLGGSRSSRKAKESYRALQIVCKDVRSMLFEFRLATDAARIETLLRMLSFPLSAGLGLDVAFALRHRAAREASGEDFSSPSLTEYNFNREWRRILGDEATPWRVTSANSAFKFAPTYPTRFVVPASITDEVLFKVRNFRSKGRIPAMCWWDRAGNGGSIWRCSQPQVGIGSTSKDDEALLAEIKKATACRCVRIVDARPYKNAVANKAKGYGYESTPGYKAMGMTVEFLNIHNIHVMRNGLRRFTTTTMSSSTTKSAGDSDGWYGVLENSNWLNFVRSVLEGAIKTARFVGRNGYAVLVHCSDGWDRTPQICCLSQMLLDPYYRTLNGFCVLVAKEWVSFGHRFRTRIGHMVDNADDDGRSPTFIQFLDCVWQLLCSFPLRFEFNENALLFLADHVHSCRFGTFLMSCEKERAQENLDAKTVSIWKHMDDHRSDFLNPFYRPERETAAGIVEPLLPRASSVLRNVRPWAAYYSRYSWVASTTMQGLRYPLCSEDVARNGEASLTPRGQMEREMRAAQRRIAELEEQLQAAAANANDNLNGDSGTVDGSSSDENGDVPQFQ